MIQGIFTVYDSKAQAHLAPFLFPHSAMAIRTFCDTLKSPEHKFHHNPQDYTLFHHGSFEDGNAEFTLMSAPKSLGNGVEFLAQITQEEENGPKVGDDPQLLRRTQS